MKKNKNIKDIEINTPWYSSYENIKPHLEYPNISIYDFLEENSKRYLDSYSYEYYGTKVSYREFIKQIDSAAKSFKSLGVNKGDAVTICMPNTPEAIISFYAINKIGAVANVIHPLSGENEIKYFLNVSSSEFLVCVDLMFNKVNNILNETNVKKVIVVSPSNSMPIFMSIGYKLTQLMNINFKKFDNVVNWNAFIELGKHYVDECNMHLKGNDPAVILYSGGTTGNPKGIVLTNMNFNASAIQAIEACGDISVGDTLLAIMPIFHGFGLGIGIHTVQCFGGTSILLPKFSSKTFDKLLTKYKPNIIAGVPTLFEALLKNKNLDGVDLSFLKIVISGGDSLSISLKEKVDKFLHDHGANIQVREGYGLTECVTGSCLTPKNRCKKGSIGIPYPDMYYKIVSPNTQVELPYLQDGEICISGPTVMLEYLNEPKETAHVLQRHLDGRLWLHTGDLGCMDEEGWIYFKQRLKRMIISSGYNIYPQYIENIIDSHPAVLMSTVIGVPHPYKVQVAKAFIVLKNGVEDTEEVRKSVYDHCIKNVATYSMPYEFEYRKELPKTLVGKVAYRQLESEELSKLKKDC